jgi:ABC-2 type transport system permease protein
MRPLNPLSLKWSQLAAREESSEVMSGVLNGVVLRLTVRATLGRKRALIFAIAPLLMIAVSALLKLEAKSPVWPPEFLGVFGYTVVLPLTALIIGTSVLGAEIDDGSIVHLLATPVPRSQVVLSKFAVAAALTVAFGAIPEYLAALIAKGPASSLSIGLLAGALVAAVIYNAVFVMLSVLTSRAIAAGLLYLLVWEGLLANLVPGVGLLSVGQYSLSVANSIAHDQQLHAHLGLGTAVAMGVIVTVAALAICIRRLSAFSITGDTV